MIGGTTINTIGKPRETAWSGSGGGCSTAFAKPSFQHDTLCAKRSLNDLAAVADPNTGVAVFAPTSATAAAFEVFGGTSVGAPLIAGMVGSTGAGVTNATVYARAAANPALIFDITQCTGGGTACGARVGYDLPTGLGSPNGTGAL